MSKRFWSMVRETDDCWEWEGHTHPDGYGRYYILATAERPGERVFAHRHAFLMEHGYSPPVVRHTCDNPGCVNPDHLLGGSHTDNMADMVARKRVMHGERHHSAKLTESKVCWIRASELPRATIAEWANVSVSTVQQVQERRTWKHV